MRMPKLCRHRPSNRAYVLLNGTRHYLGRWGTPEAAAAYRAALADWLGRDCQPDVPLDDLRVVEVAARYRQHVEGQNFSASHLDTVKRAIKALTDTYGETLAADFGPARLRALRQTWIDKGLSGRTVAYNVGVVARAFKWGAARELVPAVIYHALRTLEPLQPGRDVPRREPVQPVSREHVDATLKYLPPTLQAMVHIQLLTGARPGEICGLRPRDFDMTGDVWRVTLAHHKTAHRGKRRVLYFGPQAQAILKPLMLRPADAHLFDPREAISQRNADAPTPRRPDQKDTKVRQTDRTVGDHYTPHSYRRAIQRACDTADIPRWHPHQLRHLAATEIRQRYGLDAAQAILGHAHAATSEIYAKVDEERARRIAADFG